MSFKDLKTKAKESLKGHYGEAIKMILVYGLIAFVCGGVIGGILGAAGAKEPERRHAARKPEPQTPPARPRRAV